MRILFIIILIVAGYGIINLDKEYVPNSKLASIWDNHSPAVKKRIDQAILDKNCLQLKTELDTAHENSSQQAARTGTSNIELIQFLENAWNKLGCYK